MIYINEPTAVWRRMPGDAVVSRLAEIKTFAPRDATGCAVREDDIDGCSRADLVRHI